MTAVEFIEPLTMREGVSQATKLFRRHLRRCARGRVGCSGPVLNLIGEHTDYNAGLCLPIALPHRTFIALKPREDTKVRVVSGVAPDKVAEADLDGLKARGVDGWSAYPTGVAWALREAGFDKVKGFDAAFVSCVPLGSGLSSSAAMTCSTALALDDVYGLGYGDSDAGRVTLINAAIKSENGWPAPPPAVLTRAPPCVAPKATRCCSTAARSSPRWKTSPSRSSISTEYNLELLVVDTQAPHQLNDGQYAQRRATCEQAAKILGVANLRVTADGIAKADDPFQALKGETLDALPDETMKKRVRHVVTEIERVRSLRARLRQRRHRGRGPPVQRLLHDSLARGLRGHRPLSSTWPWTWPARTAHTAPA